MYNYDAMTRKWRKFITESYSDQEKILDFENNPDYSNRILDLLNNPEDSARMQGMELGLIYMRHEYDKAVGMALQYFSTIFDETLNFEEDLPKQKKILKKYRDFEKVANLRNIAKKGFANIDIDENGFANIDEEGSMKTDKLETFIKKYLSFRDYIVKKYDKIPQVKSAFYDNALSMSGDEDDSIKYIDLFNDKNKFKEEYVLHYLKEILKEK